jgi:PncC family amidohydrolase
MQRLLPIAELIAQRLKARSETVAVAESSTGGLITAALIAVPGASAYMLGGGVIYTGAAQRALLQIPKERFAGIRASTQPYALLAASTIRTRMNSSWGLAETGATGPTGNPYGDAAGHSCLAVVGVLERATTIETGSAVRVDNMWRFAQTGLELLLQCLLDSDAARD